MRFFGFELTRSKEKALESVGGGWRGWKNIINEPFTGAWQRNMEEKREDLYCYPALYACLRAISTDIGKLPFLLKQRDQNGIWNAVENPAYSPVLRKPNHFQTAQQFRESWLLSKLTHGNTYVLKQRDNRGVVVGLYVLDPNRVCPAVSDSGAVWYKLQTDKLSGLDDGKTVTVPASEIIHDRFMTLHHPLIGVPPVCAAYWPAVKNLKILRSAATFFGNNAQPGGILTAPAGMSDEDAAALKPRLVHKGDGRNRRLAGSRRGGERCARVRRQRGLERRNRGSNRKVWQFRFQCANDTIWMPCVQMRMVRAIVIWKTSSGL